MDTREIRREEWQSFFEGFSKRHWLWPATVEVLEDRLGAQISARALPLKAIFFEGREDSITLVMGADAQAHLWHSVPEPRRVWLEIARSGGEAAVAIESASGTRTILEFPSVLLSEAADSKDS